MSLKRASAALLFVVFVAFTAHAEPTLHAILVADSATDVREIAGISSSLIWNGLFGNIPEKSLRIDRLNTDDVSGEAIFRAIDNCSARSEDALLFFYCGHGYTNERGQPFIVPGGNPRPALFLKEILVRLKEKGVRQSIALFDCCRILRADAISVPLIMPARDVSPLVRSLFFASVSPVPYCLISSGPGEIALGARVEHGRLEKGALFSATFGKNLWKLKDEPLTWEEFTDRLKRDVSQGFAAAKELGARLGTGEPLNKQSTQTVSRYIPIEIR